MATIPTTDSGLVLSSSALLRRTRRAASSVTVRLPAVARRRPQLLVRASAEEIAFDQGSRAALQTEQMKRIGNELDSIHFSLKKASQMVKEIGRQVATDKCIMAFLFLIVCGVIAIIVVKVGCRLRRVALYFFCAKVATLGA
ncbi:putative plant SNARE 13 [Zea mays]|uniref:Putative plant SNARE 13 n=1 Tax=Zea mays TaxID=4577 RepID=A0A1D6I6M2_MAIZE|nr:putative plant SNARE 13 [Zea mays]ONM55718.1 putative plant SNARE 13 [Zea mays]